MDTIGINRYINMHIQASTKDPLINPIPGRLFWTFERQVGLFGPRQKNCYKNILLHPNLLKLGTTYLWTLTKILALVT